MARSRPRYRLARTQTISKGRRMEWGQQSKKPAKTPATSSGMCTAMPGMRYAENPWAEGKGERKYENTDMLELRPTSFRVTSLDTLRESACKAIPPYIAVFFRILV